MISSRDRTILTRLIEAGAVSPADVAEHLSISSQAVRRWIDTDKARESRHILAGLVIEQALHADDPTPDTHKRVKEGDPMSRIVAQRNPHKTKILMLVRKGKITVPEAARRAQVPISAIVGWCRIHKVPLPPKYEDHTHRPTP